MKKTLIKRDAYYDSVFLMLMSKELQANPGVTDAVVAMGTAMNLGLLRSMGFEASDLDDASPNDLLIALDCADAEAVAKAMATAQDLLGKKQTAASCGGADCVPYSLPGAMGKAPGANLAIISLPGTYAVREARKALKLGLHVMLFSDNVSLEDEIALKTLSRQKGLLLMGPDCGTAIINGQPLGFANIVRRGPIGVVGASGTGIQEVTCLVDRAGSGISQAIGTGGRDLKNERVGGVTMLMGIAALAQDEGTKVIVVISKPPAKVMAEKVVAALEGTGKPAVVHFIGLEPGRPGAKVRYAANLEETAGMAVALANGTPYQPQAFALPGIEAIVERETRDISAAQKYLRGYFTGGTLADEAWLLLHQSMGAVHSNNQTDPAFLPEDPQTSVGHTVVDLGDDVFTVGRPHPMIDPSTRTDRILAEVNDGEIAVILVDVVLGYGSHEDPAGALVPSLVAAREAARTRGGYLPVLASITGTERDFQQLTGQKAKLEAAGCIVLPSNYQASMLAVKILARMQARTERMHAL